MTLKELQKVLGDQISCVLELNDKDSPEYRKITMEKADTVTKLSKQMINNMNVVLRAEKLLSEGTLEPTSCSMEFIHGEDQK